MQLIIIRASELIGEAKYYYFSSVGSCVCPCVSTIW